MIDSCGSYIYKVMLAPGGEDSKNCFNYGCVLLLGLVMMYNMVHNSTVVLLEPYVLGPTFLFLKYRLKCTPIGFKWWSLLEA